MATTTSAVELGYLTLPVADLERSKAFFEGLFGWRFDAAPANEGYAHVENTALPMGLVADAELAGREAVDLYFRVDDLDAMVARVRELGGEASDPMEYASGGNSECRGDGGARFHLWQPAEGYA
ncbi:MAG: bleomycin resistance protein [Dehalococcoidia bacterium]|nr:bleomycin resistance protein [Dehalococcoidia bacterium]